MSREVTARAESSKGREGIRIRFYDAQGKRRAIWLANEREAAGETWKGHIAHLLQCKADEKPPCKQTTEWINKLSPRMRQKLEIVQLVDPIEPTKPAPLPKKAGPMELNAFIEWYFERRRVKQSTRETWEKVQVNLVSFFGKDRSIDSITPGDAMAWREWLASEGNIREGKVRKDKNGKEFHGRKSLGDNTVRRRSGIAKQFFFHAIESKLIAENPFARLPASVHGNKVRQFFVPIELFNKVIEAAPSTEWKAIIALARLGGLRTPSETLRLRWEDIDFANARIQIHASKTEHHKDSGIRFCPIFEPLWPFLEDLAEIAKSRGAKPSDPIITDCRGSAAFLRTGFTRILKRAGVKPWPKLFHNMRASRETELLDSENIGDVCSWIGNTQPVAMKHYHIMRDSSFSRAAGIPAKQLAPEFRGPTGGPVNGDSSRLEAETSESTQIHKTKKPQEIPGVVHSVALEATTGILHSMGDIGLEPTTSTMSTWRSNQLS